MVLGLGRCRGLGWTRRGSYMGAAAKQDDDERRGESEAQAGPELGVERVTPFLLA